MDSLKVQRHSKMTDFEKITKFIFEVSHLTNTKRTGFHLLGIKDTETVAEHQGQTAIIAYLLAKLEGADIEKCLLTSLIHDIPETRISDLNKVAHSYLPVREAEATVLSKQIENLPKELANEILSLFDSYRNDKTKEGIIVRDADLLENAIEAKKYLEQGHKDAQFWLDKIRETLKTESAKKILDKIEKTNSNSWWYNIKKAER